MPDVGLVDAAIVEILANDAALAALCPDGVWWGLRRQEGGTAFVIVTLFDTPAKFRGLQNVTLYERSIYLVRATVLSKSRTQAREAAARIDVLLDGTVPDLSSAGHVAMDLQRIDRLALLESDANNQEVWHHSGGQYELMHYALP
jgi:hypothetical protein